MSGYIKGADRSPVALFAESLDDYTAEESPVRVIGLFGVPGIIEKLQAP